VRGVGLIHGISHCSAIKKRYYKHAKLVMWNQLHPPNKNVAGTILVPPIYFESEGKETYER
jgi:hypothetical protein